jgi:hypothetical protein
MQSKHESQQHRSTTTIDDLPDAVLELIFNRTSFKDQLLCGCVCKQWLKVTSQNFTFMRKVQLNISSWERQTALKLVRMYKIISIHYSNIAWDDQKCHDYFAKCEELKVDQCEFENISHLAHMISNCKSLKTLYLNRVIAPGLEGLEAVESCVNINAINLTLRFDASNWKILQLFKIIKLDISELHIVIDEFEELSETAELMEYVHQNHRLAFRTLNFYDCKYKISALPVLFITQIKQLTSLSIPINSGQVIDQIGKNMTELRYLELHMITNEEIWPTNLNTLKTLSKLQHLKIGVIADYRSSLNLYINELQQLKFFEFRNYSMNRCSLNFSDLTPQHQLISMKQLMVNCFVITRNMLQLIFKTMLDLESLRISNYFGSQKKPLSRNNNAIGQLKSLQRLEIDRFWVDENFLRNMKLPKLNILKLLSVYEEVSSSALSNVGLLHLAKHCPKLLEIKTNNLSPAKNVIASRKTAECKFNNQDDVSSETICESNNLSEVFMDDDGDNDDGDEENGDYSN